MKIAIYGCRDFEIPFLVNANQGNHELVLIKESLTIDTFEKSLGCKAICIFSKDDASGAVLKCLAKIGTELICLRSAGYNNIDLDEAARLGIAVARVPSYSPEAIAEHAVALILSLSRRIPIAHNRIQEYNFSIENLMGFNLGEKTVGIIGTGKIGAAFAKIMKGFGSKILAYDIDPKPRLKDVVQYVELNKLLKESDVISLHLPLNRDTEYIISEAELALMPKGVMIINTGRGKLIKTDDVLKYLESGHIAYLGLDVYENESAYFFEDHSGKEMTDPMLKRLIEMENVIITSHQAFLTETALSNISKITFQNIRDYHNRNITDSFLSV